MFFQTIQVTPPRKRENTFKKKEEDEKISVLSLAPFSPLPKIIFENVPLGVTAIQKICIKNPSSVIVDISVDKVPEINGEEIEVNWRYADIGACSERILELRWCPTQPCSCRDVLRISNQQTKLIREIYIVFKAIILQKKKKLSPKKKTVNSRPNLVVSKVRKNKPRTSLSPKNDKRKRGNRSNNENSSKIYANVLTSNKNTKLNNEINKRPKQSKSNKENFNPITMDYFPPVKQTNLNSLNKQPDQNHFEFSLNVTGPKHTTFDITLKSLNHRQSFNKDQNFRFDYNTSMRENNFNLPPNETKCNQANSKYDDSSFNYNRKETFDVFNRPYIEIQDTSINYYRKETFDVINRPNIQLNDASFDYNRKGSFEVIDRSNINLQKPLPDSRKETFDIINRPKIVLQSESLNEETFNDSLEDFSGDLINNKVQTQVNDISARLKTDSFLFTPDLAKVKNGKNPLDILDTSQFKFTPNVKSNNSINKSFNNSTPVNNTYELTPDPARLCLQSTYVSNDNTYEIEQNLSTNTYTKDLTPKNSPKYQLLKQKMHRSNEDKHHSFVNKCSQVSPILNNDISTSSQINNISTSTQNNYEFNYSGREAKNIIEANLWTDNINNSSTFITSPKHLKPLSCIQEESECDSPAFLKRRSQKKTDIHQFRKPVLNFDLSTNVTDLNIELTKKRKSPESISVGNSPPRKFSIHDEKSWNKIDVLKIKRLSMLNSTRTKEKSVRFHNPDEIIYKLANPDPFAAATTQDPFMSSTLYYDDQWVHKQEIEFKKWLNALLTPHTELECKETYTKVDVIKIFEESRQKQVVTAPTKETVSSLYHTNTRLNSLRKKAYNFFLSAEITSVLSKVMSIVERKNLTIRNDKNLHLDLGLQAEIMQLLLCYNPLWLRIGLETVYGETIPLKSNSDIIGLSTFIILRLFNDPFLKQKLSVPNVRNVYSPSFAPAIKKFTLKKFLMLVYFLDQAKMKKLIPHDPCLFRIGAEIKESKQILLEFSRELLAGIGDITKYLRSAGFVLVYRQMAIDEYAYGVKDLGIDLRDGVRLTRVMEIILMRNDLTKLMRTPAISRLQKIHNVKVALNALKESGFVLLGDIEARDIVEGHREKTLSLLWQIIYIFRAPIFNRSAKIIQEWWHSIKIIINRRILQKRRAKKLFDEQTKAAMVIQKYVRSYILMRKIREEYLNIFRSVQIIQNKWRATLQMREQRTIYLETLNKQKLAAVTIQRFYRRYMRTKQQWQAYQNIQKAVRVIQKRLRATLLMRRQRMEYLNQKMAATKIQRKWRATLLMHEQKLNYLVKLSAVIKIQRIWRAYLLMRKDRYNFLNKKAAVILIQRKWRATKLMQMQRSNYLIEKSATIKIQRKLRANLLMKRVKANYLMQKCAVVKIQRKWQATFEMQKQRFKYLIQRSAAIKIQRKWRAYLLMLQERPRFLVQRSAAITIQRKWRANICMREERAKYLIQKSAIITIQRKLRAYISMQKQRLQYQRQKFAAVKIQKKWRAVLLMRHDRAQYLIQKSTIIMIQRKWRAHIRMLEDRAKFLAKKSASIKIQKKWRANLLMQKQRLQFLKQKSAVIIIQRKWRANLLMQIHRSNYLTHRTTAIKIQRKWRAKMLMQNERLKYLTQKFAAIIIQRKWRAHTLMLVQRLQYFKQKDSAIKIQIKWRAKILMQNERSKYLTQKFATIKIQHKWRAHKLMQIQRSKYLKMKDSAIKIQRKWRAKMLMQNERSKYLTKKFAAIKIQRKWRATLLMTRERLAYMEKLHAVLILQAHFRSTLLTKRQRIEFNYTRTAIIKIQRRWRAKLRMHRDRTEYLQKLNAIRILQIYFKSMSAMKKQREKYLIEKSAIVLIQRKWRATLQMRQERSLYLQKIPAIHVLQRYFKATIVMRKIREEYLAKRLAAVIIQTNWRATLKMYQDRSHYMEIKRSVTLLQSYFKAMILMKSQRTAFMTQKGATITIQRKWRATLKMRQERGIYLKKLSAIQLLQRYFRAVLAMKVARKQFIAKKEAVTIIQRKWRATLEMREEQSEYLRKLSAIRILQSYFRATILMENERCEFVLKKMAVTVLQRKWRATIQMRKQRAQYTQKVAAVRLLQTYFRATLCMKKQRSQYIKLKMAVRIIKNKWQATLQMRQERAVYLQKINAINLIQRYIKANILMKRDRIQYMNKKMAAIKIQQRWHETLLMRKERELYLQKLSAIKKLQNYFKATLVMRKIRIEFLVIRQAIVKIQLKWKAVLQMRTERSLYLQKISAIRLIQSKYKSFRIMKQYRTEFILKRTAAKIIQRKWRERAAYLMMSEVFQEKRRKCIAATKIQSLWRGYSIRKKQSRQMQLIRQRSVDATTNVKIEDTIGHKCANVIDSLTDFKSLKALLSALCDLDVLTKLRPKIIEDHIEHIVECIFITFETSNQSNPYHSSCLYGARILINLLLNRKLEEKFLNTIDLDKLVILLTLMTHWADKDTELYPHLCALVWIIGQKSEEKKQMLSDYPQINDILKKMYSKTKRMQTMLNNKRQSVISNKNKSSPFQLPLMLKDSSIDMSFRPKSTDALYCITAILKMLNIYFT